MKFYAHKLKFKLWAAGQEVYIQILIISVPNMLPFKYSTVYQMHISIGSLEWRTEETICFFVSVRFMSCEWVSPCDMEGLSAAMFVAGHTGSSGCFTLSALVLTDITCLHTHIQRCTQTQAVQWTILIFKIRQFLIITLYVGLWQVKMFRWNFLPCCSVHGAQTGVRWAP